MTREPPVIGPHYELFAYDASVDLARERGAFPLFNADLYLSRGSFASVQGFVAGQPDHMERAYQNLLARERLAVNTMLDHEKAARDAKTQNERTLYEGLALVERERLAQIRKDLL